MNTLNSGIINTSLKGVFFAIFSIFLLSSCSTVDNFLGGGMNEVDSAPLVTAEDQEKMESAGPTPEEMLAEKDQALITQGMRIAAAEREIQMILTENNNLKSDLLAVQTEASEAKKMLDQANESQIAAASENASTDTARMAAPDGGYGLHVASYELRESIEPGIRAIERQIPVLINGKPIKIARATVGGRAFNRLIIGQFDRQGDALAECKQALLLISFCEVVAFNGEDF